MLVVGGVTLPEGNGVLEESISVDITELGEAGWGHAHCGVLAFLFNEVRNCCGPGDCRERLRGELRSLWIIYRGFDSTLYSLSSLRPRLAACCRVFSPATPVFAETTY